MTCQSCRTYEQRAVATFHEGFLLVDKDILVICIYIYSISLVDKDCSWLIRITL